MTQAIALEDLDWEADARAALEKVARMGHPFDAYDLTQRADLREPPNSSMWGALFREASKDGVIRWVGARKSRRPQRRGSLVSVWRAAA
jgi:hypothetical protein